MSGRGVETLEEIIAELFGSAEIPVWRVTRLLESYLLLRPRGDRW